MQASRSLLRSSADVREVEQELVILAGPGRMPNRPAYPAGGMYGLVSVEIVEEGEERAIRAVDAAASPGRRR